MSISKLCAKNGQIGYSNNGKCQILTECTNNDCIISISRVNKLINQVNLPNRVGPGLGMPSFLSMGMRPNIFSLTDSNNSVYRTSGLRF